MYNVYNAQCNVQNIANVCTYNLQYIVHYNEHISVSTIQLKFGYNI